MDEQTSNLGVCPDCNGPFNGEFMHKPEHCKRQVMEWLSKIASKLDEEDASKVLLAGHTINRISAERDRLRVVLQEIADTREHCAPPAQCPVCMAERALGAAVSASEKS